MLGVLQQLFLLILQVIDRKPLNRNRCEEDVVALVENRVVDAGSREERKNAEKEDRHHKYHVFVEHVSYQVTISPVCFSSMQEE